MWIICILVYWRLLLFLWEIVNPIKDRLSLKDPSERFREELKKKLTAIEKNQRIDPNRLEGFLKRVK